MYELIHVLGNTYYIDCPAKIGIYDCGDGSVYLIDSGNDKDAARKVRRVLEAQGWSSVRAVLNTHSNADHVGGNKYFQSNFGCRIFAPGIEADITRHPILEPAFLFGGFPCRELRHKFLMAQESSAEDVSAEGFPEGFEVIPLPGHFFDMVGYRTPDDVVFLADCVSSAATLEKYGIGFIYDVDAYLRTLDKIETLDAKAFVPSHAECVTDTHELAEINRSKVAEVIDRILTYCRQPLGFEQILKRLFDDYGLELNFQQYALVGSTLRSFLAYLKDSGRLAVSFEDNIMRWFVV